MHFRFETCVFNKLTDKKIVCFRDVICPNEAAMQVLAHVPVPTYKDKIRVKVLMMPKQAGKK